MRSVLALVAMALAVASPIAAAAYPRAWEQAPGEYPHQPAAPAKGKGDHDHEKYPHHGKGDHDHEQYPHHGKGDHHHDQYPHQPHPAEGKGDHHHHEHKHISKVPKKSQRVKPMDLKLMNFALILELMESSFFSQGVDRFTKKDFEQWPKLYEGLRSIASQESAHAKALKQALGDHAVSACEYDFGESLNSTASFVETSLVLEAVGTSAYLGATSLLSTSKLIVFFGSILGDEARHGALLYKYLGESAFPTTFETALNLRQVWTLAHKMIKFDKCAGVKNKPIPDKLLPFPELTIVNQGVSKGFPLEVSKGSSLMLQFRGLPVSNDANDAAVPNDANAANDDYAAKAPKGKMAPKDKMAPKGKMAPGTSRHPKYYAAFLNNGMTTYVPLEPMKGGAQMEVKTPKHLEGATYIMVTTSEDSLSDDNTVAGPAIRFFN